MNSYTYLIIIAVLLFSATRIADIISVLWFKKPLWVHFYLAKRRLPASQLKILRQNFSFYRKLSDRRKKHFEHRLATFIAYKNFVGRQGCVVDDEKKVWIGATAVMLTFGMRKYKLPLLKHILVYPEAFYSTINKEMHKGEFNPEMYTLVLSWDDFIAGYQDANDNVNLGIHEFTHVIHLNSVRYRTNTSSLFIAGFNEIPNLLLNERIKNKLNTSSYFRKYALTNKFEFLAVVVENFIESPQEFKREFPQLYQKLQQMFNFRFKGY